MALPKRPATLVQRFPSVRCGKRAALIVAVGAWLVAAPLSAQQRTPYGLDELVDLLEAGVPEALIVARARTNCIAFALTEATIVPLQRVNASAEFLDALQEVCLRGADGLDRPDDAPTLDSETRDRVARSLVQISYLEAGRLVCLNGYIASTDGLVLTKLDALPETGRIQVTDLDGLEAFGGASIAAVDPERDLAVLRLATGRTEPIVPATDASDGDFAWSVHSDGCGAVAASRARLTGWAATQDGPVGLEPTLPATAIGGPLIDGGGALLGIVSDPAGVIPASRTLDLLDRARVVAVQDGEESGGFPWIWMGAGAAAAVAGVFLASGGGNGPPSTGTITIPLP